LKLTLLPLDVVVVLDEGLLLEELLPEEPPLDDMPPEEPPPDDMPPEEPLPELPAEPVDEEPEPPEPDPVPPEPPPVPPPPAPPPPLPPLEELWITGKGGARVGEMSALIRATRERASVLCSTMSRAAWAWRSCVSTAT
jgi:hypothetical protein